MNQATVLQSHIKTRPVLSEESIRQLLKLEELFHSKYLTVELLNEMVALYVNAVECFDQKLAPMRTYFLGKIQFSLSRPEVTKMLEGPTEEDDRMRDTIQMSGLVGNMSEVSEPSVPDRDFQKKPK